MRQGFSGEHQKFKCIVKRSGIAFPGFDNREELFQVLTKQVGFHQRLAGIHPHTVPADGIDFTVMGKKAERLGKIPGRKSVGAEPGMDHGDGALNKRIV